jgi:hypothetical protein
LGEINLSGCFEIVRKSFLYPDIDSDIICDLGDINLSKHMKIAVIDGGTGIGIDLSHLLLEDVGGAIAFLEAGFSQAHQSAYRYIGMYADSLASMYPEREKLSQKERKARYREGIKNMKGKRKHYV